MHYARSSLLVALLAGVPACIAAQAPDQYSSKQGPIRVVTVASGLEHPWGLAFLPDGRMLVTERPGRVRIVARDGTLSAPLAGVPAVAARGQGGMLDVALDPDHARNKVVYLSYSEPGEGGAGTAVARATLTGTGLENLTVIFRQDPKHGGAGHFGSRLVVARDGNLFVTLGERQQRQYAQDLARHWGKVVRIRPDGSVPAGNPFAGRSDAKPEIWSYGHRNPQGAALHPGTGQLWTVEHGDMGGDEINLPKPGRNYGWPVISYGVDYSGAKIGEGTAKEGMEQPAYYWDPSIAPSGLAFYTGDRFPAWKGSLFVGSMKFMMLARLTVEGEKVVAEERLLEGINERIRDVRQGPDGYLYLLTDMPKGRILRVEPK